MVASLRWFKCYSLQTRPVPIICSFGACLASSLVSLVERLAHVLGEAGAAAPCPLRAPIDYSAVPASTVFKTLTSGQDFSGNLPLVLKQISVGSM